MNYVGATHTKCQVCGKMFKTRGLGIHQAACGAPPKKPWGSQKNYPHDNMVAGSGATGTTNGDLFTLSVLAFKHLETDALYELTPDDRVACAVFSGFLTRLDMSRVFGEFSLDAERTLSWTAIQPWQGAQIRIVLQEDDRRV